MNWLLGFSVILNILLFIGLFITALAYFSEYRLNQQSHEQWSRWEGMFFQVQILVRDKFKYHLSPSGLISEYPKLEKLGDEDEQVNNHK